MNIEHYKKKLLARQQELQDSMSHYEDEARESRSAEVEDSIDQVISAEAKAVGFQESTIAAHILNEVQDALARIEDGSYGTCLECDVEIEAARLEAVPWAAYCLKHQEKRDKEVANKQELDTIS